MGIRQFALRIVLLSFLIFANCSPGQAVAEVSHDIEAVTNLILVKELKILKLGIAIRKQTESRKLSRERRFSLYALANSSLTSIGAFMSGAGRLHYANMPKKAPNNLFENATIIRVIANGVGVGGVLLEASKDAIDARKDRLARVDPKSAAKDVEVLNGEIVQLMKERSALAAKLPETMHLQYQAEETFLADMQDAVLTEFRALYVDVKGKKARRKMQLFLTGTSNLVSGGGSLYSGIIVPHKYKSNPIKRVRYGGVGGITDIATGSLNILTPFAVTGADIATRRDAKAVLFRQLGAGDIGDLVRLKKQVADFQVQGDTILCSSTEIAARQKAAAAVIGILEKHKELNDQERKHALEKLVRRVLDSGVDSSGSFSKVVNGIGTTVGAYRYTRNAHRRFLATGRAGITYGIGNAIGVEEVIRDGVVRELRHYRAKGEHALVSQILDDELKLLDEAQLAIEKSGNATDR
ncbi:MAG: hypothetical protein K2X77_17525 [Candidatus Obscuribacterales bacterium]|nr:hypothetical protein [Candidatus Obscuribacterales bacterium]